MKTHERLDITITKKKPIEFGWRVLTVNEDDGSVIERARGNGEQYFKVAVVDPINPIDPNKPHDPRLPQQIVIHRNEPIIIVDP